MAQCRVEVDAVTSTLELNQRTRTQNLAVMTISLTDIAADGWATAVD